MDCSNKVYIGCSLDGFIADENGGLEWLDIVPNEDGDDMGYYAFMDTVDALLMGRSTFQTVLGFGIEWPYKKPVFVWSSTITEVPEDLKDKVFLVHGTIDQILKEIHSANLHHLYLDGGKLIQSFLQADKVDEMIITSVPVLIGRGIPLFGDLDKPMEFELLSTSIHCKHLVQRKYRRKRKSL